MHLPPNSIIASGPVIIEENKVLLNKELKGTEITPWMFPGGEVEDFDSTLEEACKREAREEMGIEVDILKPLKPIIVHAQNRVIILIHYLARRIGDVQPGSDIATWDWHDIYNLPGDCTPNVHAIIKDYIQNGYDL